MRAPRRGPVRQRRRRPRSAPAAAARSRTAASPRTGQRGQNTQPAGRSVGGGGRPGTVVRSGSSPSGPTGAARSGREPSRPARVRVRRALEDVVHRAVLDACHRVRSRGLFAVPLVCGGQGRALVGDQGAAGRARRNRTDGDLPRRPAGDVRPADRLHALVPPSGTRREAAVRLPDPDLRLHLGARAASPRSPTTTSSTRAQTRPSPRSSPRRAARCSPASTGACISNGYTQLAGAGTYAARDESDVTRAGPRLPRLFPRLRRLFGQRSLTGRLSTSISSSDNTFLDRYQIDDADVLRNRVFLEGFEARNFWSLNGYYFQGLRPFDDQDTIPVALPLAETRIVSDRYALGLLLHGRLRTSWR